jgi:hypothetical protein
LFSMIVWLYTFNVSRRDTWTIRIKLLKHEWFFYNLDQSEK